MAKPSQNLISRLKEQLAGIILQMKLANPLLSILRDKIDRSGLIGRHSIYTEEIRFDRI
ncbi:MULTISPECIES: hypothetical protein [unclassified Tolypothrix]|uniref:hypothetical protein n=1 Tax=unclassified Tolypothrix TaxID=2649714 RepID=UPI0005EAB9E0|nr:MULTISPECIES: hypothetical protein [unclassified Tolypothrix]EKE97399.1 hypothetical protein FDUTEX481_05107 [Tolypothrix sp. PCC 7601]